MSSGYIPVALRRIVFQDANRLCGYCLSSQEISGTRLVPDHIIPTAKGGLSERDNLWMACRRCNEHKGARTEAIDPITEEVVPLFNPRFEVWALHFVWNPAGTYIIGLTAIGRATIIALNMNDEAIVTARTNWARVGWHPPDSAELWRERNE